MKIVDSLDKSWSIGHDSGNMKNFKTFFFGMFLIFSSLGAEENEVAVIDRLIVQTKIQLEIQKTLRQQLCEFQEAKELFMLADESKAFASKMVSAADSLWKSITENHMEYLFSEQYLEELQFFSSISKKHTLKRP